MVKRVDNGKQADLETLERLDRARNFIDHCYDHPLSPRSDFREGLFSRYHYLTVSKPYFETTPATGSALTQPSEGN